MADGTIGFGIIGANLTYGWGGRTHLPAVAALPEYDLAAVCTTSRETAQATAGQFDIKRPYWDFHAMVQDPAVEVVDVCVRVPQHYELVKAAIEAGKHVFCEWPLGRTTAEAEELAALAHAKGVKTMVGLQARGAPSIQRLRELIAEGYVGKILTASLTLFTAGLLAPRTTPATWSLDREAGVHTLSIAGGHAIDAFCWCLGDFAAVSGSVSTQAPERPLTDSDQPAIATAPDNVVVSGRLQNGATASVHIASVPWQGRPSRLEVFGTEGTIIATADGNLQLTGMRLQGARANERELHDLEIPDRLRIVPAEVPEGTPLNVAQMLARFAHAIRTGEDVGSDFDDAVRLHRLLDAIVRASDTQQWVAVP
ncbi:MAG: Gfo/Idh/MocA family oxidoreductase [Chloroflexi bacterium]|nr:Gfo/Idh/MocA family oxidoreductase [Chloroflexota bacterium]